MLEGLLLGSKARYLVQFFLIIFQISVGFLDSATVAVRIFLGGLIWYVRWASWHCSRSKYIGDYLFYGIRLCQHIATVWEIYIISQHLLDINIHT